MSVPSNRDELIRNAIAFLSDPKTQASTLTQRIQFLEAKGLTPPEIDLAIKRASVNSFPAPNQAVQYPTPFNPPYGVGAHPPQRWDWRDYFITAVFSGAVAYGAVSLFKKYLLPHLQPPSSTAYEEDRDALTAQFDAAEALLKEIQAESAAVRAAVEEQTQQVTKTTAAVDAVVAEMRSGEAKTRDEMRELREEINNIRDMLPKMNQKIKDSQTQSLLELQQELKSLKALLLSRGTGSIPSPSLPVVGRPSIPAWQLAASTSNNGPAEQPSSEMAASSPSSLAIGRESNGDAS